MPEQKWEDKSYYDYRGGIVSNYDAMHIPENALADANNVFCRRLGSIKKRLGYTILGSEMPTGSYGVMGLHAYYGENIKHLLAVVDTSLYRWNITGSTWSSITSSLYANERAEFANALNNCIIVNSADIPKKLTDTTLTDLGTGTSPDNWRPLNVGFVKWRHNVLWFAHIKEKDYTIERSRVRQSEIRAIEGTGSYPWTYYYDSEADDGFPILGIHPLRDNLVVMKKNRTAQIVGTSRLDYGIFNYDGSVGTVAHRSMQEYGGKLFHLSNKGIYAFDGVYNVEYSDAIGDLITSLNQANLYKSASTLWDKKYFLSVPKDQTDNDTIIVFDGELESFTKLTGIKASCFATFIPIGIGQSGVEYLYFGESDAGNVYKLFSGYSDNGSPISASFETKKHFTGDPNWINDVRHCWIEAKGDSADTLTIKYRFDENQTYSPTSGWTFNLSNRFQRFTFPEGSYGRLIQFKVENSSSLPPFEFFGITINKRKRREFS